MEKEFEKLEELAELEELEQYEVRRASMGKGEQL